MCIRDSLRPLLLSPPLPHRIRFLFLCFGVPSSAGLHICSKLPGAAVFFFFFLFSFLRLILDLVSRVIRIWMVWVVDGVCLVVEPCVRCRDSGCVQKLPRLGGVRPCAMYSITCYLPLFFHDIVWPFLFWFSRWAWPACAATDVMFLMIP